MSKFSKILLVLTVNLLLLVTMFYFMLPVRAAGFTVTNTNDSGAGSLRKAIADALLSGGADVITFDPSLNGQTITLTTGTLTIADELTIDASSLADSVIVSGNEITRVFYIQTGAIVTMTHLIIADGATSGTPGPCFYVCGGGIFLDLAGRLTLNDSLVTNNFASSGGGITNGSGNLTINNSRIISNESAFDGGGLRLQGASIVRNSEILSNTSNSSGGGGIYLQFADGIQIISSTIAYNRAISSTGGGIYSFYNGLMSIENSTIAHNHADNGGGLALDTSYVTSGAAQVSNSTLSGNEAVVSGGAFMPIRYSQVALC